MICLHSILRAHLGIIHPLAQPDELRVLEVHQICKELFALYDLRLCLRLRLIHWLPQLALNRHDQLGEVILDPLLDQVTVVGLQLSLIPGVLLLVPEVGLELILHDVDVQVYQLVARELLVAWLLPIAIDELPYRRVVLSHHNGGRQLVALLRGGLSLGLLIEFLQVLIGQVHGLL